MCQGDSDLSKFRTQIISDIKCNAYCSTIQAVKNAILVT